MFELAWSFWGFIFTAIFVGGTIALVGGVVLYLIVAIPIGLIIMVVDAYKSIKSRFTHGEYESIFKN